MTARSVTLQNINSRLPREKNKKLDLKHHFPREKNRHKTYTVPRSTANITNCWEKSFNRKRQRTFTYYET